jgi:hypothetical protein
VTHEIFSELKQRRVQLQEALGFQAGIDPTEDRYKAGYITAITDLLNTDYEDTPND